MDKRHIFRGDTHEYRSNNNDDNRVFSSLGRTAYILDGGIKKFK